MRGPQRAFDHVRITCAGGSLNFRSKTIAYIYAYCRGRARNLSLRSFSYATLQAARRRGV
jgi:hypothetical protein